MHHWVYETSQILHRDLSINNIMWYRIGNTVYGVLCDWDLAEVQSDGATFRLLHEPLPAPRTTSPVSSSLGDANEHSTVSDIKPKYRTGTGPFMAMDLLREEDDPPPPHLYRHDLESLFYIFIYVCIVLDLQQKIFRRLPAWERGSLWDIGHNKKAFLTGGVKKYKAFFANCDPAFKPLVDGKGSWGYRLWFRFSAIEKMYFRVVDASDNLEKPDPLSQDEEDDEFMEPEYWKRKRETHITFHAFMSILGEPQDIPTHEATSL